MEADGPALSRQVSAGRTPRFFSSNARSPARTRTRIAFYFVERRAPLNQGRLKVILLLGTAAIVAGFIGLVRTTTALDRSSGLTRARDGWEGYLVVPASDSYRFVVYSNGPAALRVEGVTVATERMSSGGPVLALNRGLHAVRLDSSPGEPSRVLMLQSRGVAGPIVPIPRLYLVPRIITFTETRLRRIAVAAGRLAPVLILGWSLLTVILLCRHRRGRVEGPRRPTSVAFILVAAAVLLVVGSWWGLPAHDSWAPDEVLPGDVHAAVAARFSHGWATKYPPAHFMLLAILFSPWYAAEHYGLLDLTDLPVVSTLLLVSRLTSLVMATGIIWSTYAMTREHFGRRSAVFAALVVVSALPFTYYAKTANLDVPYLFWLALALRFFARTGTTARPSDFYGFALTGALAIATKDQAYGFFIVPAGLIMAIAWARPGPGVPSRKILIGVCGVTALALVLLFNVPFNLSGVRAHIGLISGPNSQGFRMYARTMAGTWKMVADALRQMANVMTWPLLIAALAGAGMAVVRRQLPGILLLLASFSYVVTFLWMVLYQYDRFWLGVVVATAPMTGCWLDTVTRREGSFRAMKVSLAVLALVYAIGRCVALDVLMLRDSRYATERYLWSELRPGEAVAAIGQSTYLPRPEIVPWTAIPTRSRELNDQPHDLLVVNVAYGLRRGAGLDDLLVSQQLPADRRYVLLGQFRAPVPFPLSLERRFTEIAGDKFSNLTKINPLIRIYRRVRQTP
ncbi:MAG TPA: glycosyltransferase family 39 protein [Vicinamibacterales bacterium]